LRRQAERGFVTENVARGLTMAIGSQLPATAEDLLELHARTGARYELVEGQLREMPPTGAEHGGTEFVAASVLHRYLLDHPIGRVFVGEVLCRLRHDPETARAADAGIIRNERLPEGRLPVGPIEGAPDLVVEIVSPSDSATEVIEKTTEWLAAGAAVVWTLYPRSRGVVVWRPTGATPLLRGADLVDAEPVLPGFRCRAAELFPF
jgi:Uma2 family endonuclease